MSSKRYIAQSKSRVSIPPFHLICAGRRMKSKSGRCCAQYPWAKRRTTALAAKLGTRDAREVTEAIACNPIAVLVPCHRVIKKDGSISGYRWGVKRKRELLNREKA